MGGKPRPSRDGIAVRKGMTFRVPRAGLPARHVRIAGIQRSDPQQPKITYYLVTRSGRRSEPKGALLFVHWLSWRDGAWRLPPDWEECG